MDVAPRAGRARVDDGAGLDDGGDVPGIGRADERGRGVRARRADDGRARDAHGGHVHELSDGGSERVSATRGGKIVVGRYTGVVNLANTIGYGRWSSTPDGEVVGGAMFLDRDFDKNDSRRRLLRIHELGHALGYNHVKSRTSIMNPAIGPEPTDFDRAGAIVAFQRTPGNRSPDADPAGGARMWSAAEGGARWSEPTVCR